MSLRKSLFGQTFLVTQLSSLITHHLKIPCLFVTITHFPSLNIFHTICGPHTCHWCSFFIFFSVSKLTKPSKKKNKNTKVEPVEKKEKKEEKKPKTDRTSGKKKKKELNSQPQKRKKKSKGGQKLQLSTVCGSPMCI